MSSKLTKIGYDLRDVSVVQAPESNINHRADVDPRIEVCGRKQYPVFVSPMSSVTDQTNWRTWIDAGFTPVVPRSVQLSDENPGGITWVERMEISRETFVSVSLSEASELLKLTILDGEKRYFCIDLAHGTLESLYRACKEIKEKFGDKVELMTGNVATPAAYRHYAFAGIDWMRVSIGTGSRCTTAANTGIYYPSATLLDELWQEKEKLRIEINTKKSKPRTFTKIIMDGGISNFDDIQKALVLGADAVMSGNLFARCEEACGPVWYAKDISDIDHALPEDEYRNCISEYERNIEKFKEDAGVDVIDGKIHLKSTIKTDTESLEKLKCLSAVLDRREELLGLKKFRDYYGMSTKRAQRVTGGDGKKTAEGISKPVPVEYSVKKWADNMESFLRSGMSYTNSKTIEDLHKAQVIILGGGDVNYRK